ncbi:hypothetical protein O3G_MSEX009545 [Manduca sexta]|uniref:Embryonic stem cell-specific 5-hydroxymethylcytosine-binding protein n=1 Tax=Manduca sexta TaxID=7130 RepID=A0A922CS24_MANSE|nr:hypothetical protein O3G_MSEX009545 [Manduca sexta]
MCGRTGLSLNKDQVQCACSYKPKGASVYKKPDWLPEHNAGKEYKPSYNIAPTDVTPILISSSKFKNATSGSRLLKPMMWGIIPPWHKIDDASTWRNNYNEETGWDGINLLHIAGLYDIWQNGDKIIYAYSVITMDSNETLSWLHSRMPAILDTQDQIDAWLDTENVNPDLALEHLKPVKLLSWHKVSTTVNNSRNKSDDCNKRMKVEESKKSQKSLTAWLTKPEKRKVSDECNRQVKKIKIESCTKSNSS